MNAMILCNACRRHVRSSEPRCPFCNAEPSATNTAEPVSRVRGLSRAALYAVGAAIATGVTAGGCASTTGGTDAQADVASESASDADTTQDVQSTDDTVDVSTQPDTICCPPYGCVFPDEACGVVTA
jgi:hypothetical protein